MNSSTDLILLFKYFSQLFGESNADEDVSPDTADPEAAASAGKEALTTESNKEVSFPFPSITVRAPSKNQSMLILPAIILIIKLFFFREMSNVQAPEHGPRPLIIIQRKYSASYSTTTLSTY